MAKKNAPTPSVELAGFNPNDLIDRTGTLPSFHFEWGIPGEKKGRKLPPNRRKKRRLIGRPNEPMRRLHTLFKRHLEVAIEAIGNESEGSENFTLRKLPSSAGCTPGSNHYKNSSTHKNKNHFFITDFSDAYRNVDLDRLTKLLVFIFKYRDYDEQFSVRTFGQNELAQYAAETDPLFPHMRSFVAFAFAGLRGEGIAVGGPLSPYLLNLYCEVYLDSRLRQYLERSVELREDEIFYTRYVDDLVFSSNRFISIIRRNEIRQMIRDAGFSANDMKTKVVDKDHGTVFVTKVGLETRGDKHRLVFPKKKRRRLEGLIKSHLQEDYQKDIPDVAAGFIAEFVHYYKLVTTVPYDPSVFIPPSKSDERTMALCKEFEERLGPYMEKARYAREKRQEEEEGNLERARIHKRLLRAQSRRANQ